MKFELDNYIAEVDKYGAIYLTSIKEDSCIDNDEINILATLSNKNRAKYVSTEFKVEGRNE